jgi:hypothetical protein
MRVLLSTASSRRVVSCSAAPISRRVSISRLHLLGAALALGDRAPQLELGHDLAREHLQRQALPIGDPLRARLGVQHADRAERQTVRRLQQRAGVEAQARLTRDQRIAAKRASAVVSGTTKMPGCRIAWAQIETSSGSSSAPMPTSALNHCRPSAIRFTTAMGASKMSAARRATSSNSGSRGVSRIA